MSVGGGGRGGGRCPLEVVVEEGGETFGSEERGDVWSRRGEVFARGGGRCLLVPYSARRGWGTAVGGSVRRWHAVSVAPPPLSSW
jgi:hypothetical protein